MAQKNKDNFAIPKPSTAEEIQKSILDNQTLRQQTLLKDYPVRSVGPTIMGGRVVDIEANPRKPKQFYVALASGGLFKTENNGQSFKPIFDHQDRLTIGDIALSYSNPEIIWVGTGENNSSRSSYAGFGVYKSKNGGETWQKVGLENTQHVGRIVIHPQNADIVWVAAIGSLYSKNKERGIFKTQDGGKTWKQVLFVNDSTGVIDLVINPKNPNQLWACSWERSRKPWDFKEGGIGSAVYRSEDGGETWQKSMEGLPESQFLGRMGIDVCIQTPNILYLVVDNQKRIKKEPKPTSEPEKNLKISLKDLATMSKETFLALPDADLDTLLRVNRFPEFYNAKRIKNEVRKGLYLPKQIAEYNKNANDDLFDTEVIGAEIYKSEDGGKSWKKTHTKPLETMFFTYGYYFGQIRVNPIYPHQIYVFGVTLQRSDDGGKTFKPLQPEKIHADHHAMWINILDSEHILVGNDGGVYQSYDAGEHFIHLNSIPAGQFYTVAIDFEKPYNIYGGLQDNGTYFGSSKSVPNQNENWENIGGGDGMFVQVNPQNNQELYVGFQFGNYYRIEKSARKRKYITPKHLIGEPPLRFNWRTPLLLSKHSSNILYIASQKLHFSLNKGDTWNTISPDLTKNRPQGDVPFSTISAVAESPLKFGLLYVGTDDGNVWITKNNGDTWENITKGLPENRWVAHLYASTHDQATVFVVLNGYRFDEFKTYIFQSNDYGKTWTSLKNNLPDEVCNVLIQDLQNPEILYLGTDQALYVSVNQGKTWQIMGKNLPNVAIYDLVQHPRDNELVIGTHGRSIYVIECKYLQNVEWDKQIQIFSPIIEPSAQETNLITYFKQDTSKKVTVKLWEDNPTQTMIFEKDFEIQKGFNCLKISLKNDQGERLKKGKYKLTIQQGTDSQEITIML
ncbi:MAG: glycosyl hydrolase [Microscillaceae bacterium]|nr:glycosyl hydrolase [Microscillaceae bacterium]MDW8459759.1 glycosyl hydrolase [Cytophagales bacterium]